MISTGPMEILEAASCNSLGGQWLATVPGIPKPKVKFECEFVAESRDPIRGSSGPFIVATKTFDEVEGKQFDIILVPAGSVSFDPESIPKGVAKFIRAQVPGTKYVLSRTTSPAVQWVAKARWVVDGKFWTSSGVTAGQDMAYEFLKTVTGEEFALAAKNMVELRAAGQDDDEFADVFKLT
ncbi:hypothetical protein BN14_05346 [Rhizoctonia solani AG-1 IB]|uniref:DJ-1/PfpI domain-containing protein n=1 Tax=Thanatephorus cucumeris (strain AG1-IB / isolate 7/3/14) TaxID=1108050 RepID=M5C5Z9_THACB|nr:hypothetical protein BN14_05346 [Rhizoctonia solani AG-1 IB]